MLDFQPVLRKPTLGQICMCCHNGHWHLSNIKTSSSKEKAWARRHHKLVIQWHQSDSFKLQMRFYPNALKLFGWPVGGAPKRLTLNSQDWRAMGRMTFTSLLAPHSLLATFTTFNLLHLLSSSLMSTKTHTRQTASFSSLKFGFRTPPTQRWLWAHN